LFEGLEKMEEKQKAGPASGMLYWFSVRRQPSLKRDQVYSLSSMTPLAA